MPSPQPDQISNVMVDSLLRHLSQAKALDMPRQYRLSRQGYALLTLHRPSNADAPAALSGILDAPASLQAVILFPVHSRTWRRLTEAGFLAQPAHPGTVGLSGVPRLDGSGAAGADRLRREARGDHGPQGACLTLRAYTERPVAISEGTNQLVGLSPSWIRDSALKALADGRPGGRCPELWNGRAAERIVAVLREVVKL